MKATMVSLGILLTALGSGCQVDESKATSAGSHLAASSSERQNVPANSCEIYVERLRAAPSSHGSASISVIVRVPWLGNGEMIQKVGFFGRPVAQDLGNSSSCNWSSSYNESSDRIHEPLAGSYNTRPGEYEFYFPVRSGTVLSNCPGFHYAWIGSFFLETNYRTYWLNPNMNPEEQFYFDNNGYSNVERNGGWYQFVSTRRDGMSYYNPRSCER